MIHQVFLPLWQPYQDSQTIDSHRHFAECYIINIEKSKMEEKKKLKIEIFFFGADISSEKLEFIVIFHKF